MNCFEQKTQRNGYDGEFIIRFECVKTIQYINYHSFFLRANMVKNSLISYLFENHDLIKEKKTKQKIEIKEIMYVKLHKAP